MLFSIKKILKKKKYRSTKTSGISVRLLLYNLFFVNLIFTLYAQKQTLTFQHFGIEQGMSSELVASIYQDQKGYMWFLTDQGLDRYDGYSFTSYKYPKKDKVVTGLFPGTICEDKEGYLWVASFNGGIEKFDPLTETFKNYLPSPEQVATDWANEVISIFIDEHDIMWIGTGDGFYKFNKNNGTFIKFIHDENDPYSLGHNSVNCIFEDSNGILWLATGGGLDKFDRITNKFFHYWHYPNNQWGDTKTWMYWTLSIAEDSDNVLWIGTDGGLLKFDKKNEKFTLFSHSIGQMNHTVLSLCIDASELVWFIPMDGLGVFNKKTQTFTNYRFDANNPESISSNSTLSIFIDRAGSIWMGTQNKGLNKLDFPNSDFKEYILNSSRNETNPLEEVYDIYEDKEGTIWIGTNSGLKIFDLKNEMIIAKNNFNNVGIEQDKDGNVWAIPGKNGLYKLSNNNKWTCYIDSQKTTYPELVNSIFQGKNNHYWIGNVRGDLCLLNPFTKEIKVITNIKNSIYAIFQDSFGLVWFGGFSTGLFCYDPDKKSITEYNSVSEDSSSLIDNSFYSFCEDKSGTLWFGCINGISRFNRSKNNFTRFYGNDDFLKGIVRQILEDDRGNLWLSTEKGITKFNPVTGQFKDYYSARYFPKIKFWRQVGFKAKDGELFFGGERGFIRFHPDSIKEDTIIPPIEITAFKKFEKYYPFGKEIELKHDDNYLTFEFAALSYINSSENQYAYMIEGIDKDWVYCGTRRFATYPNLNPGEYVFKVKGSTCNRVWNEAGTSIRVIILPPWWKRWWAYLLYIVVLLSLFILSTRFYLNRQRLRQKLVLESEHAEKLEEIAKMKSDFFANISHEFRTPLTLILGPAEKIAKNESANPVQDAGIIIRNSKRLLQLVNQLMDLSKLDAGKLKLEASSGNIVSFVKGITLSFESLSESRDVIIKIKSDKEFIEVYFNKEKMIKVLSNLLSNAFKFTPQRGNVIITIIETTNSLVKIKIKNTGVGIPQKELPKLFDRFYQVDSSHTKEYEGTGIGLALVKELIELHHGSITVESQIGNPEQKGWTEFTITLPLGRLHLKDDEILSAEKESDSNVIQNEVENLSGEVTKRIYTKDSSSHVINQTPQNNVEISEDKTIILVVEDNYDMREYIKASLSDIYQIEEAVNGEQGVRIAESIIPDLIISDLMMPKMDGNELTRILKNDERTSHIPIIILTAKSGQENKLEGLQTGADDYLTKPFDLQELRVRVENLINIRKKLQEKFSKGGFVYRPEEKKLSIIDSKFMSKVNEVIEKHLSEEEFSIEEFGSEVGMSRSQLHRKLRALIGKSPSQYVRTVRLARAKKMIEEETGNVSEVAYSVGFSSPAYFSKCFKEEFGYPPRNILN